MTAVRDYWELVEELVDHGIEPDPAETRLQDDGLAVPRRCHHCGRPAYYDLADDGYHHAVNPIIGCFLIGPEPDREWDTDHPLVPEPEALT